MSTQAMKCAICGSEMKSERQDHFYRESGLSNVVLRSVEIRCCSGCGEEELVIPRMSQLHRLIALQLAKKPTPLSAEEIRYLRKSMGWSNTDFARTIGVTEETASRWQTSKKMAESAERLLRMTVITEEPERNYGSPREAVERCASLRELIESFRETRTRVKAKQRSSRICAVWSESSTEPRENHAHGLLPMVASEWSVELTVR